MMPVMTPGCGVLETAARASCGVQVVDISDRARDAAVITF